jgi:hypothetical protein
VRNIGRRQYKLTQIRKKQKQTKYFSKVEKVKTKKFKASSHHK